MNLNNPLTGENLFSEAATNMTGNKLLRFEKESFVGESVNNYFKSMKEIEAEFLSSMSVAKNTLKNMLSDLSQFGQNLIYMDGDINFPDPDELNHGYMEENY